MAKRELHKKAIELRNGGMSYSEIKKTLGVSKSTLSDWLNNYPLTKEQLVRFEGLRLLAIEKYRQTMLNKRNKKYHEALELERKNLFPLDERDLFVGGLFLYWGEGGKTNKGQINISNSDPKILKIMKRWLIEVFEVPREKMRLRLTLYTNMDISVEKQFWRNLLDIPFSQFRKIQIKEGKSISNAGFSHGTCELVVTDTKLKTRILAGLELLGSLSEV